MGRRNSGEHARVRRPAGYDETRSPLSGVAEKGDFKMRTQTVTVSRSSTSLAAILAVLFLGIALVMIAGHVQGETLHGAAHDIRHAAGFPCH